MSAFPWPGKSALARGISSIFHRALLHWAAFLISAFEAVISACVEVGTPVAQRPPHRSRRAVFPHRALRVDTLSSRTGRFARWVRHSYGTGCLCVLRQHVGPFSSVGVCALPLDTMSRSDSRNARRRFLSLRRPSCLALVVSAAGTLRASSVPCVCSGARRALRPRQAFHALTMYGRLRVGFRYADTVPACVCCFRG